jgi:hypothetical protein
LSATDWRGLGIIYTTSAGGILIIEIHVDVDTLHGLNLLFLDGPSISQPYATHDVLFCKIIIFNKVIKRLHASIDAEAGAISPLRKMIIPTQNEGSKLRGRPSERQKL